MSQPVVSSSPDAFTDRPRLHGLVGDILDEARRQGAVAAEAGASMESGLSATVRLGEVETIEYNRDKGLAVTVYFPAGAGEPGLRKGSASTTDFGAEAVRETVRAACDIARYTSADRYAGPAEAEFMAVDVPDLDLCHPWGIDAEAALELALECERAALDADARIRNSEGASVSSHEGYRVYANSHGFVGGFPSTRHSLSCAVIGEQGGAMQRDHWYTVSRVPGELEAAAAVGRRAAERTLRRLGARRVGTEQVPVVFAAELAGGLLGGLLRGISGGAQYRRASFLLDAMGERLFPEFVRIHEQPHLPRALGSAPFDNEGVATQARDLVADGVLKSYVLDSYSARRLGRQTTGNAGGVHNLRIDPGPAQRSGDQAALLAAMGRGLLVTELMGQGLNAVTGDYSRGAAGFWVEGGEIQYPVEELTIAGNLREMFAGLQAVGSDVDTRGNVHTGSWLIERMTMAGE